MIVEMLVQKCTEINIDLNAKDQNGMTIFHHACEDGDQRIVEMFVKKFTEGLFNIDLNAKYEWGNNCQRTAFHYACLNCHPKTVEIILQKSTKFKFDPNSYLII